MAAPRGRRRDRCRSGFPRLRAGHVRGGDRGRVHRRSGAAAAACTPSQRGSTGRAGLNAGPDGDPAASNGADRPACAVHAAAHAADAASHAGLRCTGLRSTTSLRPTTGLRPTTDLRPTTGSAVDGAAARRANARVFSTNGSFGDAAAAFPAAVELADGTSCASFRPTTECAAVNEAAAGHVRPWNHAAIASWGRAARILPAAWSVHAADASRRSAVWAPPAVLGARSGAVSSGRRAAGAVPTAAPRTVRPCTSPGVGHAARAAARCDHTSRLDFQARTPSGRAVTPGRRTFLSSRHVRRRIRSCASDAIAPDADASVASAADADASVASASVASAADAGASVASATDAGAPDADASVASAADADASVASVADAGAFGASAASDAGVSDAGAGVSGADASDARASSTAALVASASGADVSSAGASGRPSSRRAQGTRRGAHARSGGHVCRVRRRHVLGE